MSQRIEKLRYAVDVARRCKAIHVDLNGHPRVKRLHPWSHAIDGSAKRRFFAVLHIPPVDLPVAGVRAAMVTERRAGK